MPKPLNVIATCAENRVIGREGKRPWTIAEDAKFFHEKTAGQTCVVGRRCFETWPRATFDRRQPLVVTSRLLVSTRHPWETEAPPDEAEQPPLLLPTLSDALTIAETLPAEIYLCGGGRIYEEALALPGPMRLHLTLIHADVAGDTFFPDWRRLAWRELARRESSDASYRYTFLTLER